MLALLLAITCLLSMAACGDKTTDGGSKDATDAIAGSEDASEDGSSDASTVTSTDNSSKGPEYSDTDENGNAKRDPNYKCLNYDVMKGIWISQFDIPNMFKSTNEKAFRSSVKGL